MVPEECSPNRTVFGRAMEEEISFEGRLREPPRIEQHELPQYEIALVRRRECGSPIFAPRKILSQVTRGMHVHAAKIAGDEIREGRPEVAHRNVSPSTQMGEQQRIF